MAGGGTALVVVLQHDQLSDLETVVVAPLRTDLAVERLAHLHPDIVFDGVRHSLIVDQMAAVRREEIQSVVGSAADAAWGIKRAIDLVFIGF